MLPEGSVDVLAGNIADVSRRQLPQGSIEFEGCTHGSKYSELTKTSTALARLAVTCVLSAARRLVLIFVNSL